MAEQVFRSPGFFPREIEESTRVSSPSGTPAGVIGVAEKGPAFVPILISSFKEFTDRFGKVSGKNFAPFAIKAFLKNGGSCVFVRVLGAGANTVQGDINTTESQGTVRNAGFKITPSTKIINAAYGLPIGNVVFLAASHSETDGTNLPILTEAGAVDTSNGSYIRAMIFTEKNTRVWAGAYSQPYSTSLTASHTQIDSDGLFKLFVSASDVGTTFSNDDNVAGLRVYTASLNPNSVNHVGKILNTVPDLLDTHKHMLYASFDIDDEVASPNSKPLVTLSGSAATNEGAANTMGVAYGRFDTRFQTAKTPMVISQPFGNKEYDLFRVHALSDGAWPNTNLKISIAQVKKSNTHENEYGTFTLLVRAFNDTDESPKVLESYPNCNLNLASENYVGNKVGTLKTFFDFDQPDDNERRVRREGKYPNKSKLIRLELSDELDSGVVPKLALPCGFHGYELLKTTSNEKDTGGTSRLEASTDATNYTGPAIVPPIMMRRKITKNQIGSNKEKTDKRLFWGVQFERVSGSATQPNRSSGQNALISAYAKMLAVPENDMLVTGSAADVLNNNKFTFANINTRVGTVTDLTTGSIDGAIKDFQYERDAGFTHASLATVLSEPPTSNGIIDITFNSFTPIAQFSMFMYGGFDGVDITSLDEVRLNDKATSVEAGGRAVAGFTNSTLGANQSGTDLDNAGIQSYRRAIEAVSNPDSVDINLLVIPGIREPFVTDYASKKMRDRFDAFYIMDLEQWDKSQNRLFDDRTVRVDVNIVRDKFQQRSLDNNFAAAYFPDVVIEDGGRRQTVPPSVSVLGAIAFNDKVGQPWWAPAGFNRGGIEDAVDTDVRLHANDRNALYEANINPISRHPKEGVVVKGQKTIQARASALDRVNVRRLLIEIRRAVKNVGNRILFEPNRQATIDRFKNLINPILQRIQTQAGIERFKVVIDNTTTTQDDINNNTLRGKVFIEPTKTAEFIAIDFIVTDVGVQFD